MKIEVPILARVEGEGALDLEIENDKITKCQLKIYEPPRYFEKFLEGREPNEIVDAVSRICGLCPIAYQITVAKAMENAMDVVTNQWVEAMRLLVYCGEWMESHYTHIHILAAPDFLKYNSIIEMARDFPKEVSRGIKLQQLGNELIRLFGARSVHPVGLKVGGFYSAPSVNTVHALIPKLEEGLTDAIEALRWFASFEIPDIEHDVVCVSLYHEKEYPVIADRIVTSDGLNISIQDYDTYFNEFQVRYSTALHASYSNKPYLLGPLARLNLNFKKLPPEILNLIDEIGLKLPSKNMFHSIIARGIEGVWAIITALELCKNYLYPESASVEVKYKAGSGWGATEAPRGMQIDHFILDHNGLAQKIRIIPPTSQNQPCIEADLKQSLEKFNLAAEYDDLRYRAEMIIRNYDPCISCATHFLKLNINRK